MAFDARPACTPTAANSHAAPDCRVCPVGTCMARNAATAASWTAMVERHPAQMPGATPLYLAGSAPTALFAVRAGCVKTYSLDADGNERIRGFHFPGDLVGLDALGGARHQGHAMAVTPSQVCAAPIEPLMERLGTDPDLAGQLLQRMRHELGQALALGGEYTADQRVAAFLLQMQARIGNEQGVIRLPMTRREVGSYLRLATETVCRVLARFEDRGWVSSQDKRITLHDRDALQELAEAVGLCDTRQAAAA